MENQQSVPQNVADSMTEKNEIIGLLHVSPTPHVRESRTTQSVMADVLIALLPATIGALYFFGANTLLTIVVSIAAAVLAEYAWQAINKKTITINDLSAAVTGLLVALNVPPQIPVWMPAIGSIFAILVVKQLFGGLGHNFMNPALAARAFLMASFPIRMTTWVLPGSPFAGVVDAVSSATPLAMLKEGTAAANLPVLDMFFGNTGGTLGEVSSLLLLVGGVYLVLRKVISPRIPVAMLGSIAVMAVLFGGANGFASGSILTIAAHLFGGGAMLGAIFMATDYASTPVTVAGQWIFGIGCGVITMVFRLWGANAEGVSYAILLMNVAAPLIERYTRPRVLGEAKKQRA